MSLHTNMKVVCLVLCVALARLSAGHIFRRQYYPAQQMDRLVVQPLEYINQRAVYNSASSESSERHNQRYTPIDSEERYHKQYQGKQRQYEQKKNPEQRYNKQKYEEQRYEEPQYAQQVKHQYQKPQFKREEYQTEQYKQEQNKQQKYQQVSRTHDSTSAESSSREKEWSKEYAMPMYADPVGPSARLQAQKQPQPVYGDAISWRGVQIAASPKNDIQKEDIERIFADAHEIMSHVSKETKDMYHQKYERAALNDNEDVHLNATQLLTKYQYVVETHTIKTDDGYFLTLFRIPPRDQTLMQQRPVVFLMHGLLGSADDWLLMGPGKSLAYMLADAGYEVWLGNARGSRYSRRHASKHPVQPDFWQFGTDEIALHDLPAMIDYVLKTASREKLYYVGFSQGTTAYFALAAARPEYNDKIIMMYALAPMVYMSNVRSPLFRMIAPTSPLYERLHEQLGHGEFKPSRELVRTLGGVMCENEIGCRNVCSNANFVMAGVNVESMDVELIPVIMGHLPAGASARQMKQYAQGVASHEFTKYDYGTEINERVYGSVQPPKYDMEKVKAPVTLYYSEEDWLAHPRDVERLAKELPNMREAYKVPDQHFSHMDYQFARTAPQTVYKRLIESIQKQASEQNVY